MTGFSVGDRVRVDLPDESDLDHAELHGRHGEVVRVLRDDAGRVTGDSRDSVVYRVELDSGRVMDFRWRDLRPGF